MPDPTDWSPVHHEDAPEPTPAPASPKPAARRATPARERGTQVPVGMSLFLPPEVTDMLADLADSQRDLVEAQDNLAKQMAELTRAVAELAKAMGSKAQDQRPTGALSSALENNSPSE